MSISAEDALRSAMLHATGYSGNWALRRAQERLASLGYANPYRYRRTGGG